MPNKHEVDEVITVSNHLDVADRIEKGYFYLDNRVFKGPFEKSEDAGQAALKNCKLTAPGECRAIYHGSVRTNLETNLKEPLADMRQTDQVDAISFV